MRAKARQVLAAMVLGAAILAPGAQHARAQGTEMLPAPTPLTPRISTAAAPPPFPAPLQPMPPPPDLEAPVDPGRDGWGPDGPPSLEPGLFLSTELAVIHPVLRARLANDTPLRPSGDTVTLPSANQNWTVAPWFDVGYRLPRSLGLVSVNYRFFNSEGSQTTFLGDQSFALRSRLNENFINLDYGTTPYQFLPRWDFWWRAGVQLAGVFLDSHIQNSALEQSSSSNFRGAGPHARLEIDRRLDFLAGLSLYARFDGAAPLGRINQNFTERLTPPDGFATTGRWNQNGIQMPLYILVQAGFNYVPPGRDNLRFSLGYVYEHWFAVGQLGDDSVAGNISNSSGEFGTQGIYLRGQWGF